MEVKSRPILMSGEMIRAYKAVLKGQTRRTRGLDVVNKAPDEFKFLGFDEHKPYAVFEHRLGGVFSYRMPYGRAGDTLWFKETHAILCREADIGYCPCETEEDAKRNHYVEYRADTGNPYPGDWPEEEAKGNPEAPKWKSSMFMKHEYSRFKDIPILDVKVERLHNISFKDAFDEGYPRDLKITPVTWYFKLWDKLNGDTLPAKVNPWVWVYSFKKYESGKGKS